METLTDRKGMFRMDAEDARDLLDATWGRHLADQVVGSKIRKAIEHLHRDPRWMASTRAFIRKHIRPDATIAARQTREEEIGSIARRILGLETLDTQNSDGLDFHELAVWTIREALDAAFEAGRTFSTRATTRR